MVANRIFARFLAIDHAAQSAGVVVHCDLSDAGQRDRPGALIVAHADGRQFAFGVFVAQPKRGDVPGLLLEPREADPFAFALAAA
jgi:hypothetical protein